MVESGESLSVLIVEIGTTLEHQLDDGQSTLKGSPLQRGSEQIGCLRLYVCTVFDEVSAYVDVTIDSGPVEAWNTAVIDVCCVGLSGADEPVNSSEVSSLGCLEDGQLRNFIRIRMSFGWGKRFVLVGLGFSTVVG